MTIAAVVTIRRRALYDGDFGHKLKRDLMVLIDLYFNVGENLALFL